ncbi:MAG: glycosyltransferase [Planctomycetes bacterium]|nr:glycosyltransferase [Planctomycetota bacterium]
MDVSVIVETWNLGGDPRAVEAGLAALLDLLRAQTLRADDVVVTHAALDAPARARLEEALGRAVTWVALPAGSDYHRHKNAGFDAARGRVAAFLDGDCAPVACWLERLTAPILGGEARVAAGATAYRRGPAALGATAVDFPVFPSPLGPGAVRGFFANNVAFARETFAARRFPELPGMFHGQCQLLALALQADRVLVRRVPGARVEHAWPEGARDYLAVRLLRGADTRAFAPHLLRAYAPRWAPGCRPRRARCPPWRPRRARHAGARLLAARPRPVELAAGAAAIAAATALDAVGAVAAGPVRRKLMPA